MVNVTPSKSLLTGKIAKNSREGAEKIFDRRVRENPTGFLPSSARSVDLSRVQLYSVVVQVAVRHFQGFCLVNFSRGDHLCERGR
jgi:hypothetical protein